MPRRHVSQSTVKRIWEPGSNLAEYRERLLVLLAYADKNGIKHGSIAAAIGITPATIRYAADGTTPVRVALLRAIELALGLRPTVMQYKLQQKAPRTIEHEKFDKLRHEVGSLKHQLKQARARADAPKVDAQALKAEITKLREELRHQKNLVVSLRCSLDVAREATKITKRPERGILKGKSRSEHEAKKRRLEATMAWASLGNPNPPTEPPPEMPPDRGSNVRKDRLRLLRRWWLESTGQVAPTLRHLQTDRPVLS